MYMVINPFFIYSSIEVEVNSLNLHRRVISSFFFFSIGAFTDNPNFPSCESFTEKASDLLLRYAHNYSS